MAQQVSFLPAHQQPEPSAASGRSGTVRVQRRGGRRVECDLIGGRRVRPLGQAAQLAVDLLPVAQGDGRYLVPPWGIVLRRRPVDNRWERAIHSHAKQGKNDN
jgi:hypothetical protein